MKYGEVTMGQTEAVINRMGGFANWVRFAGGQGKIVFDAILTLLRNVKITVQPAITTSKEYFEEAGVKWTNNVFMSKFYGLKVGESAETELQVSKLEQNSLDASIITELGDRAEIGVSQFHAFLALHRKYKEWFIFYLRDRDGNLWAVGAYWSAGRGGWRVSAISVESPSRWPAEGRVVSRN